jgi:hypothetical protein
VYNIDLYDEHTSICFELPEGVDGYYFSNDNNLPADFAHDLGAKGWKVVKVEPWLRDTKFVKADRVMSKYLKFICPEALRMYDYVLTHDCNIRIDYHRLRGFIARHMHGTSSPKPLLLKKSPYHDSVLTEIESILQSPLGRIGASRQNIEAWYELMKRPGSTPARSFETNLFIFRPDSARFAAVGAQVFSKCTTIPRDQFLLPWALQQHFEADEYAQVEEQVLVKELGLCRYLVKRHGRN